MFRLSPRLRNRWTWALAGAAALDAITYLWLPFGAEGNPLWSGQSPFAVLVKAAGMAFIVLAPLGRYARPVRAFGVLAWGFGALSNLAVLWR